MYQTVMSHIPNIYTMLIPVDMRILMPETGLGVNIPKVVGGVDAQVVLPK